MKGESRPVQSPDAAGRSVPMATAVKTLDRVTNSGLTVAMELRIGILG